MDQSVLPLLERFGSFVLVFDVLLFSVCLAAGSIIERHRHQAYIDN